MLDKFITSLSKEQKEQLLEALQEDLDEVEEPDIQKEDFVSSIKTKGKKQTKIPVTETERFNEFVDDGTESRGEEFKTPKVELTARRRPPAEKVNQTCSRCGKSFKVHPTHARDWFICDKCIGAR